MHVRPNPGKLHFSVPSNIFSGKPQPNHHENACLTISTFP